MEEKIENKICPACKNSCPFEAMFCEKCEFPFKGTEKEKSIHIGRFIGDKGIIIDAEDALIRSRNLLYIAAGLYTLGVIINMSLLLNNLFVLAFNILIIITFVVSALFLKKSPLTFLILPLALLLSIYTINFIIDPNTLVQGILFKILIIGSLIYSIYNFVASEKFKKKFNV